MVVGIDYSMSSPAMCLLADDKTFANSHHYFLTDRKTVANSTIDHIHCELHKPYAKNGPGEIGRFTNIANYFIDVLKDLERGKTIRVFIEDYSMGSKGRVFNIAENTAILKYRLNESAIGFITIPPTVIKKFAAGKGNADKEMMYKAFLDRNNPDIKRYYAKSEAKVSSPVSDLVDAYFIALLGSERY
jgi:hypothetical protein